MTRKRSVRERRRLVLDTARETATAEELGLTLEVKRGRARLVWDIDPEGDLALLALPYVRQLLEDVETELVLAMRVEGASWSDLGFLLGTTGEAARKRFQPLEVEYLRAAGGEV